MEKATLHYRGFSGTSEISHEDNVLHGKILFINDLITYEGDTPAELAEAFKSAVVEYERTCAELGVPPEKPCSGTFNVRMPPELHRAANLKAAEAGQTLNELVNKAIEAYLEGKKVEIHNHTHHHARPIVKAVLQSTLKSYQSVITTEQWQQQESSEPHRLTH